MQNAETVLGVLRERGRRALSLNELYRQLFNPELYLLAYGRIYANEGAMTPGVTRETGDGMSMDKIAMIIDRMRHERYRFTPVRRVHIPKKDGKTRPLGMPTWSDKLVGEVVRLLLEAYYEPTFSDRSHGFRPGRGCHTALREVVNTWKGTTWFIEGDISDCFGSLDHRVMLNILAEKIHDNRFLRLVRNMLQAGYLEDWIWNATLSGAPQGGVTSPILSNIYLDRLDRYVETVLIPRHTRGTVRAYNPDYTRRRQAAADARRRGDHVTARQRRRHVRRLPSGDPYDPGYRRLRYVRYADDILLGFTGPKIEAELIKADLAEFLRNDLALELSEPKTLITHGRTSAARFLGYEITVQHNDHKISHGGRTVNGMIGLRVPRAMIREKCAPYQQFGQPECRTDQADWSDYHIVADYGSKYRGIVQYYLLAINVSALRRLRWFMETSMLKTLALKHKSSVHKITTRHKVTIATPHGPRTCFEAKAQREAGKKPLVARFGDITLKRQKRAVINDRPIGRIIYPRKELTQRLRKGKCEICGQPDRIQVHQIRKLTDLNPPGTPQPDWTKIMAKRRRKTLIVCHTCHDTIHNRKPATATT
jgi:group II intron reverse transcriptase/maturase